MLAQPPAKLDIEPVDVRVQRGTSPQLDSCSAFFDHGRFGVPPTARGLTLLAELVRRRVTHVHVCGEPLAIQRTVLLTPRALER